MRFLNSCHLEQLFSCIGGPLRARLRQHVRLHQGARPQVSLGPWLGSSAVEHPSPFPVSRSVDESLARLGVDYVDVIQVN